MSEGAPPDAAALAGLLADDDRLRVVAALVLGASTADDVATAAGLDQPRTWRALGRLVAGGLVEQGDGGILVLLGAAFQRAAREAAASRRREPVGEATPPEVAKVVRAFVRDGRLLSIPVTRSKRLVVLDLLAQDFEPGRRYSEPQVNLLLGKWHPDVASLRRYLVDEEFLDRHDGRYWRSGGSVGAEDG